MASSTKGLNIPVPVAIALGTCIAVLLALIFLWWVIQRRKSGITAGKQARSRIVPLSLVGSSSRGSSSGGTSSPNKELESPGLKEKFTIPPQPEQRASRRLSAAVTKTQAANSSYLQMEEKLESMVSVKHSHKDSNALASHTSTSFVPLPQHSSLKVPESSAVLQRHPSLKSFDSASMYSTASAPPDFHDRVFQSWRLDPVPASPLSHSVEATLVQEQVTKEEPIEIEVVKEVTVIEAPIQQPPKRATRRPSTSPQTPQNHILGIREALAPETYDSDRKPLTEMHPYRRASMGGYQVPHHVNRSLDDIHTRALPAIPLTAPPTAYFPPPKTHYVPTSPSSYVPPRTPPKSPKRFERHSYLDIS